MVGIYALSLESVLCPHFMNDALYHSCVGVHSRFGVNALLMKRWKMINCNRFEKKYVITIMYNKKQHTKH